MHFVTSNNSIDEVVVVNNRDNSNKRFGKNFDRKNRTCKFSNNKKLKIKNPFKLQKNKRLYPETSTIAATETSSQSATLPQHEQQEQSYHFKSVSEELQSLHVLSIFEEDNEQSAEHCNLLNYIKEIVFAPNVSAWTATSKLLASRDELIEQMNIDYTELLLEQSEHSMDGNLVMPHLTATDNLLHQFFQMLPILEDRTSMPESIHEMVFNLIDEYVLPRLSSLYSEEALKMASMPPPRSLDDSSSSSESSTDDSSASVIPVITPGDAATIISWMEYTMEDLKMRCPDLEMCQKQWMTDKQRLVQFYLDHAVSKPMKDMIKRLCTDLEPATTRRDANGHVVTGTPNDIIFMLDSQLSVARDCLPSKFAPHVLHACQQELLRIVEHWMFSVGTEWKQWESKRFVALINDTSKLIEYLEDKNEEYFQDDGEIPESFLETGEMIVKELIEVNLLAMTFLGEYIMASLCSESSNILTSIGSRSWESQDDAEQDAIATTIATLRDYFADLKGWFQNTEYYFPKVLKACFDLTGQKYVQSFFSNTLKDGLQDPARAAYLLQRDYVRLVDFFSNEPVCAKYHGMAGFYSLQKLNARLHFIMCLSLLVNPSVTPEDVSSDIEIVLAHSDGADGSNMAPMILHLVGMRKKHTETESFEWIRVIARGQRFLEEKNGGKRTATGGDGQHTNEWQELKFPDLRNSRFIQNVRPPTRLRQGELDRRVSAESMHAFRATAKFVTGAPSAARVKATRAFNFTKRVVSGATTRATAKVAASP